MDAARAEPVVVPHIDDILMGLEDHALEGARSKIQELEETLRKQNQIIHEMATAKKELLANQKGDRKVARAALQRERAEEAKRKADKVKKQRKKDLAEERQRTRRDRFQSQMSPEQYAYLEASRRAESRLFNGK